MTILSHAYALSDANTLVSFNPAAPAVGTSIPVTGLMAGETLVGIDVRPANGVLYALGVDAAINTATLYTISPLTGVATVVGTLSGLSGNLTTASGYGFDFNPVSGFIRVTTDTGLNFRINPDTASVVNDPMINPAGLEISGVAYTNDEIGVTTLYTLDSISDHLMIQGGIDGIPSPNGGVQTQVGPIPVGVDFSTANGFDIPPGVDSGLALLTVGGTTQLYSINLVTGAGTLIGDFLPLDGITPASGLAILNPPSGADFNVDGRGDILFRHDSGVVYLWEMNGLQIKEEGSPSHAPVTTDWHVQGVGDFNGDFTSDFLWRQDGSAQVYLWEMAGQQVQAEGAVAHAFVTDDWHVQGVGDFNGDGNSDVLWRQDGSGQVYVWEMNGQTVTDEGAVAHAPVTDDWHVQGVGDFNGDGNSDVLWRQDGSDQVYVWEMNGQQVQAEGAVAHAPVTSDWHVESVNDFNGDGKSDVLWRQDGSGQVYVWEMVGQQVQAEGAVAHAPVTSDWQIFSDQNFI
jgi:Domain of unknown function (DUF4394)/FG-GAP-like repeat/FG-GAP repeat